MQILKHFKELTIHPKNAGELKGLILQLAIQGKLTQKWRKQNPNVEPASVILEKIKEEKAKLVKEKKIKKKEKALPDISEEEIPFELPERWEWCRLGQATTYGTTNKLEAKNAFDDIWILELEDVEKESSRLIRKVRFKDRNFKSTKNRFNSGDIIYGKLRPYLDKVIVADEGGACTTEMIPIKVYASCSSEYVRLYLKNRFFINYANNSTHGMNLPRLGTEKALIAPFALPPLEEQHAIVSIVNQLFKEVDELEVQTKQRVKLKEDFVNSALKQLAEAKDVKTHNCASPQWAFLQQHFKAFFNTKEAVKKLRETILQLAVQGKLSAQWRGENPNVESASVLLEKIKAEKEQLIKDKKIKKEKALPEITDDEIPYELPDGWVWCRLGDFGEIYGGSTPSKARADYWDGNILWVSSKDMKSTEISKTQLMITKLGQTENRNRMVPENSILMVTRSGILKRHFPVSLNLVPCTVNQDLKVITPVFKTLGVYIWLMLHGFESEILEDFVKGGTTVQSIEYEKLLRKPFPYPPLEEQKAIVAKVNSLLALCEQLEQEIEQNTQQIADLMQSCVREVVEG